MANDLIVVLGASTTSGTMPLYLEQLTAAGIDYWIDDLSNAPWLNRGSFIREKVERARDIAKRFSHYEKIIVSDAFDITFYGKKEDVLKKIPTDHVLHAAEKNCYPNPAIASRIAGTTPWRFVNGGLSAGTPQAFAEWAFAAECHPGYKPEQLDQEFLNERLAEGHGTATIDSQTRLFFCLFGGYSELAFAYGLPINTECATCPNFLHANGKWSADEMFAKYERSLECIQS